MKITEITASKNQIMLHVDGEFHTDLTALAYMPLICGDAEQKHIGELIASSNLLEDGCIVFPRTIDGHDLLICRFEVKSGGAVADGVKYVTHFSDDFSKDNSVPTTVKKPVGTWVTAEEYDYDYLEFGCMMTEINCAWIQKLSPETDDIVHVYNGKEYYSYDPTSLILTIQYNENSDNIVARRYAAENFTDALNFYKLAHNFVIAERKQ